MIVELNFVSLTKKVEFEGRKNFEETRDEDSEMSWELRILEIFFSGCIMLLPWTICVAKKCWIMRIFQEFVEEGDLQ